MKDAAKAVLMVMLALGTFIGFMLVFAWIESLITGKWYEPFVGMFLMMIGFFLTVFLRNKETCPCCDKKITLEELRK